ncbi:MAG: hypothetical protein CMH52_06210 [Myxococcales bacterium]|nr:hypothetical protein [Myxococcales bacterium]
MHRKIVPMDSVVTGRTDNAKIRVRLLPNASWFEKDAFKAASKSAYPTNLTAVQHGVPFSLVGLDKSVTANN